MKALIVTDVNNNRCEVIELQFTHHASIYSDELGNCYHITDFVELDSIEIEQVKADKMIDYWSKVAMTILEYKSKGEANEHTTSSPNINPVHCGFLSRIFGNRAKSQSRN